MSEQFQFPAGDFPKERPNAPVQRIPTITARIASGSVAAGCRALTCITDATFAGTILGMPVAANITLVIPAPSDDTLGAVAYTRTAGTLYTLEVR